MKKLITILVTVFLLFSCQENKSFDEKITDSLNSYLKKHSAGDKFLAMESFSILKKYTVKERKEKVNENSLNAIKKMNESFPSLDILAQFEKEYEFLKMQTDETAESLYEIKFIIKKETLQNTEMSNEFKALVLNDKKLSVIFVSAYKENSFH